MRVRVTPAFLPGHSDPEGGRYVFGYRIRITNEGTSGAQLMSRRWLIINADGDHQEVIGDGVVGRQPHLAPGEAFEYESFCPLSTAWGTMEGTYTMQRDDGAEFSVGIARFYLVPPSESVREPAMADGQQK